MSIFHVRIKSGPKGTAKEHATYITRQGRYTDRDDLVYSTFGNMPSWAQGDPKSFWREADNHERANAAAYREYVIALSKELNTAQNCVVAERLKTALVAGGKPFQMAVHENLGKLGGEPNPHMHLMFSDRVADGIDRPAEKMFSRFNAAHPENGGRRKDSGGKNPMALRDEIIATREKIAGIQNEALAEFGLNARVDHRSLRAQGRLRQPERHLGPARVRSMSTVEKAAYADVRALGRDA